LAGQYDNPIWRTGPPGLQRLAESIPGLLKVYKFGLCTLSGCCHFTVQCTRRRITVGSNRGFNNKFMIDIGSPLAAIYSTSTMEHHHFNMAINILQQVQKLIEK
jgi:hypothetical protein